MKSCREHARHLITGPCDHLVMKLVLSTLTFHHLIDHNDHDPNNSLIELEWKGNVSSSSAISDQVSQLVTGFLPVLQVYQG